mmetsp:Transcript_6127/g.10899  ORF Transcript_6127/g.10899 Transcript_6127/m.10899 type:complete len:472 (-) Transcript_6127:857-2272(-)|eukprot:CAMPEP_0182451096 /NCGR_PEP_ID=MMETSP1172-20130603/43530_1 /TAXON_ID=708627 /ORGANISM="Timspurckia oligopyrenoides, Strain CCMP3278" /LENGTH=471 /DNA_ID=CAMNT_0024648835 /DNA_START=119 /DNA_END=1534 /DNA_ORIENTATION=-
MFGFVFGSSASFGSNTNTVTSSSKLSSRPISRSYSNQNSKKCIIHCTLSSSPLSSSPLSRNSAEASSTNDKLAVLLLNLGGPERPQDVEGFLYNLFSDPDIIRLPPLLSPLQGFLANEIARSRAPKSRKAYESIGGGSPIVRITNQQASAVETELSTRGLNAKVFVGMRYWHPFTEDALKEILEYNPSKLVIVPLYPQYSISTSGSSLRVLNSIFTSQKNEWNPLKIDHTVVSDWYARDGYLNAMSSLILDQIETLNEDEMKSMKVMFSAHGVPESYIEAGDPYQKQIEDCCELIMNKVREKSGKNVESVLSYQSRVGPVQWLQPYTDVVLEELGKEGLENLVVVPISFVSEHIETLEEIDIEYRELALESGIKKFLRVPALDCNEAFIKDLADMAIEASMKPSVRVNEAMNLSVLGDTSAADLNDVAVEFGFNSSAETLNGRLAMLTLAALAATQYVSGPGITQLSWLFR